VCSNYNLSGDEDPRRGFIPAGNEDGEEISPQAFVEIPAANFFVAGLEMRRQSSALNSPLPSLLGRGSWHGGKGHS
jgi:hypothetical protein